MSDVEDIYKAPQANLEQAVETDELQLASRSSRFWAAMIDGIISVAVTFPLMMGLGIWEMSMQGVEPPMTAMLILAVISMAAFLAIHGYFLKKDGQTLGKKVLKIYIVGLDGQLLAFPKLIGLRYVPLWIVAYIPVVGGFLPLVDILFIFRKDRRCVHDLIAGTKVVKKSA
ncbi:RDD family protein [Kaarinaea lacus]